MPGRCFDLRYPLGCLLVFLLAAGAPPAAADTVPEWIEASFRVGYDDNLLNASDAERAAFFNEDPGAYFVVDRMEDSFFEFELEGEWTLGRPLGLKSKARLGYRRIQFTHAPIKAEDWFNLNLSLRLHRLTRLGLEITYAPQIYGRHRRDKDAAPGDFMFRSEAHNRWELGLSLRQILVAGWRTEIEAIATRQDYVVAFDERDRRRLELDLALNWGSLGWLDLGLEGGWRRSVSRNLPDLGKDLSYRQFNLRPSLSFRQSRALPELELSYRISWRRYTSELPDDWNHFRRNDVFHEMRAQFTRSLTPSLALIFGYTRASRVAELDSQAAIDYDEEGSFSETVLRAGIGWRWEPKQED
jgi:hypothetical protein